MTSPIRTILVHLDPTAATPRRLALARELAGAHGAQLSALYAVTPSFIELPYTMAIGPTVAASLVEIDEQRRERVLQAFDKEMIRPGPLATWSQTDDVPTEGAFAQQAFYADLLVLGQHDPADAGSPSVPPDFVENVLVSSGRPAIVVPHIGWQRAVGETIAIAWKESPEAARAVRAAVPFLQRAAKVHVFAWGEGGASRLVGPPLDLERYLLAHGVHVTWHREESEPPRIGELLLSRVFDVGADLLVMGCYGHSRAREWILGGASRTLLQSMTLPVLMAH
ncbi:universal stress protein [Ramlibacter sp. G-1-2-2]|uniref:Universal stress protein n=1 Tax=Ramlibacter agri TaxID=2728837 RepID=A0A848HG05_9BURK|nr:universal stress protein [Ramlibacter agri]NML47443.1 universal stress protein [Ramlibacter agri]